MCQCQNQEPEPSLADLVKGIFVCKAGKGYVEKPWSGVHAPKHAIDAIESVIDQYLSREKLIAARLPIINRLRFISSDKFHQLELASYLASRVNLPLYQICEEDITYVSTRTCGGVVTEDILDVVVERIQNTRGVFYLAGNRGWFMEKLWERLCGIRETERIIVLGCPLCDLFDFSVLPVYKDVYLTCPKNSIEAKETLRPIVKDILYTDSSSSGTYWSEENVESVVSALTSEHFWSIVRTEEVCFELMRRWILNNRPKPALKHIQAVIPHAKKNEE